MELEPREKALLAVAAGLMGLALLGIVVVGCVGSAYLLWQENQVQLDPPPPPLPAPIPPATTPIVLQTSLVGVWIRTDDDSHDMALFNPLRSEGYGAFFSSEGGSGAWFTGHGTTLFLVSEGGEVSQWSVTFPTATTMTIERPTGTQTWRRVAALT